MVTQGKIKDRISDTNWYIYILSLQDDKYYVRIAIDPNKRFLQHQKQEKDSSNWCKKHRAIELIEIIVTKYKHMKDASLIEDIYTLKYIEKFGAENVRGGRYLGNEIDIEKKSRCHLKRGYISIMHKLISDFNITYSELNKLGVYECVINSKNTSFLNNLFLVTRKKTNQRGIIIAKNYKNIC
ncbi:GIY-YIG nuclease family protein [Formosa algae]|uniref:GIY-YIG nuclease family protein n=1 Tax=Formosa algae TaxID=225843 RepID=UPI000CCE2821|nr:GIY-YIG nuclease family protein [Formosa algae]PNW27818.1 hypothetical protein BKP44_11610 [Formosa algae]